MLVDASDSCNMLNFQMGNTGVGNTVSTRSWNIKASIIKYNDIIYSNLKSPYYKWMKLFLSLLFERRMMRVFLLKCHPGSVWESNPGPLASESFIFKIVFEAFCHLKINIINRLRCFFSSKTQIFFFIDNSTLLLWWKLTSDRLHPVLHRHFRHAQLLQLC